jgi:hypothetical protein
MTTETAEPVTRDEIDQFLARLTDEQRTNLMVRLLVPVFEAAGPHTTVVKFRGKTIGDLVPVRRIQPGQQVGMSDEAREALSKTVCKTREEWKAYYAAQRQVGEGGK